MAQVEPADFTHLRVHSHFSLLQSTAVIPDLVHKAAAAGLKSLALTDNDSLYGAVTFTNACRQAGLKPILGMTVGIAAPTDTPALAGAAPGRVVLLAAGPDGYKSLCRLSACSQAHPDREIRLQTGLTWDSLKSHRDGLICVEAGQSGWIARFLKNGQRQAAVNYAARLGGLFTDCCYLGLELNLQPDIELARDIIQIGSRFGLPPAAAQPITCLEPEEADLLPLLMAIKNNGRLQNMPANHSAAHWRSPAEIGALFAEFPEAIDQIGQIIKRCRPALADGPTIWPALKFPEGETAKTMLIRQAEAGLADRRVFEPSDKLEQQPGKRPSDYKGRLEREVAMINDQGFAPLFLLVADIARFARGHGIPVSTRGSVANSLTAYALGITTVDPVAQGLLFERFLNPARANLPDIDLDFCSRRRDEVLAYVREKYGADRVAIVGTMNTMQPKSAVRETAKAYGLDETQMKKLSNRLPRRWHPDPQRQEKFDLEALINQFEDQREKEVLRQAYRLVGQPHHLSLHPGGVVITPAPLTDFVPVQWAAKGYLATQFDFRDIEAIGLPKIDLLGIRALTVLADTAVSIRDRADPNFRLEDIPLDDPETASKLAAGETIGVFQCESTGAQRTLRQLRAKTVRDLAVANAFFKPGPATGGMAQSFIRRYRGEEKVTFLHAALEPILGPTQGVLLFQEQVLRIAVEIAGLNWGQADHLRRGMSKFKAREMKAMQAEFVLGCQRPSPPGPGFSPEQAETLWGQIIAFAGYGFNQGHATAYADVSYRSAYLKTHYPAEFLCARLADRGGFHHPAIYIAEARRLGISVRPPHVNYSRRKVRLSSAAHVNDDRSPNLNQPILWLGLGQVKHLRRKSVQRIISERPFSSLGDLLDKIPLQSKETHHLIQCGALDGLGESRAALLAEAKAISRAGTSRQLRFDFAREPAVRPETAAQRLAWESALLGLPVSVDPLELFESPSDWPLRQLSRHKNKLVRIVGYRLPGWTGGKGWFLSDTDSFVIVRGGQRPSAWESIAIKGRYRVDTWGGGWFQVE